MPLRSYASEPPFGQEHEPDSAPLCSAAQKLVPPAACVSRKWNVFAVVAPELALEDVPPMLKPLLWASFCWESPPTTDVSLPAPNVPVGWENRASTCWKSGVGPNGSFDELEHPTAKQTPATTTPAEMRILSSRS